MFDHPVSIVVLRGGQEVHLQLTLNRTLTASSDLKRNLGWWVEVAVSLIQLLVGLLVLFKRPRDLTAVAAGIFLCGLGTGNFYFVSPNAAVVWRSLPLAIQWLDLPRADTRYQWLTGCAHAVVFAFVPQASAASPLGMDDAGGASRASAGLRNRFLITSCCLPQSAPWVPSRAGWGAIIGIDVTGCFSWAPW